MRSGSNDIRVGADKYACQSKGGFLAAAVICAIGIEAQLRTLWRINGIKADLAPWISIVSPSITVAVPGMGPALALCLSGVHPRKRDLISIFRRFIEANESNGLDWRS